MPIRTNSSLKKLVAALLLPTLIKMQSNPVGSTEFVKDMLAEAEKMVK